MSSSPSPTTSTRAATISSRKERRPSSFPSLAALNPFRSKSAPEPSTPSEPFLVAPDIWSTDATAKVFGYIVTDALGRPKLARSHSAGPEKRNKSPAPLSRILFRGKSLLDRSKEVHKDDGTDDFSARIHRRKCEAWDSARQQARDEARLQREDSERCSKRGKMKTVSQDDELTERGANPRTGVVSPYVMSDGSADGTGNDYIARSYAKSPTSSTGRRTSSGRWQQIGGSWRFVDTSVPSPTRVHPSDRPSRQLSAKKVQDRLLAQMPGADNPEPENMSTEQIRMYQESVERAYKLAGGDHAMLDPETLPTPRQASPAFGTEGPSTPPNRLHKIRRKEVGSALIPSERSDDTIIINGKQRSVAARPPPIKIPSMDRQHVRIMSPSMAALGVPPRTPLDVEASFLGPHQQYSRTASAGQFLSTHPLSPQTNQQERHQRPQFQDHMQSPPEACSAPRVSSPTLNQFRPRLQFPHLSHFVNLESPSYRRPAHLLPPSLRSEPQKRQLVKDAATITTTITSGEKRQRPGMQRSESRNTIPRASHRNLEDHIHCVSKMRSQVPLIKIFEPNSPTKSTEANENAISSVYQRNLLYSSHPNPSDIQKAVPSATNHSNDHCQSSQSQNQFKVPGVSQQDNDHCRMCLPLTHPSAPRASHHNNNHCPSSLAPTHSNVPKVTSSKPTGLTKEVEGMLNMPTDPIQHTPPHPCQSNPESTKGDILQASRHHGNPQSNKTHGSMTSVTLKGCKILKPTADSSERKMNGSLQSRQTPTKASIGVDGVVHAARVAMGDDQRQHQQINGGPPQKRAGHMVSLNQTTNARGACGIAPDQSQQNRDADGIGITQARDHQDRNILAPGSGTDMSTSVGPKRDPARTTPIPNSEGGVCIAGNWAKNDLDDTNIQSTTTPSTNVEELLVRRRSLLCHGQDLALRLAAVEVFTQPKTYLKYVQEILWLMNIHVASTLYYGSPAIKTLRSSGNEKMRSKERIYAAKEVALAIIYALVLLNVAILLRRVMMTVLQVFYWVWHPFTAVAAIIKWCLIT